MSPPQPRSLVSLLASPFLAGYLALALCVAAIQFGALHWRTGAALEEEATVWIDLLRPEIVAVLRQDDPVMARALAEDLMRRLPVDGVRIGDNLDTWQADAGGQANEKNAARILHRAVFHRADNGKTTRLGYVDLMLADARVNARVFAHLDWLLGGIALQAICLWLLLRALVRARIAAPLAKLSHAIEAAEASPAPGDAAELLQVGKAFANMQARAARAQALEAEKRAVEERNAEQSRFLANASHDLRQPLHALSLYLGAMARDTMPETSSRLIGKARHCVQVVEDMFRSILDLSRLEAGATEVRVVAFPLQGVLDAVQLQFEPLANEKGISLRIRATTLLASSDPALVGRIVHNLVSNAVRYTQRGGVLVACRRAGHAIRFDVHDTGPGIDDASRPAIFGEYGRGPQSGGTPGAGLGLAIVRRMAGALGHELALRSVRGRGTSASLRLPMASGGHAMSPVSPISAPNESPQSSPVAGKVVLIVDDDPAVLDATSTLIERWRGIPVTASSHAEAVSLIETPAFLPDAVLCDFQLSGEASGESLIRLARRGGLHVPALLITGARVPELNQPLSAHVLYKPVAEETLRRALATIMTRE